MLSRAMIRLLEEKGPSIIARQIEGQSNKDNLRIILNKIRNDEEVSNDEKNQLIDAIIKVLC